jgi:hypothetical protein
VKIPTGHDPHRWKDLPPTESGIAAEIGAAERLLKSAPPLDPLRVAQMIARASRPDRPWSSAALWGGPAWVRTVVLVVASLLLGGIATAVSGKIIQRFNKLRDQLAGTTKVTRRTPEMQVPRQRRRLAVNAPEERPAPTTAPAPLALPAGAAVGMPALAPNPAPRPVHRRLALAEAMPPARAPHSVAPASGQSATPVASAGAAGLGTPRIEPPPLDPSELGRDRAGAWAAPTVKLRPAASLARPSASEGVLLARALRRLRHDHDALWALGDLDEYTRDYPRGNLRREAALARAEVLLALDRNEDALAVLDGVKLEPTGTDRRARLARAELRAQDGRRAEAIGDFDRVLDGDGDDELAARALFGRAVCRLRGGDLGGARTDLREYVRRFPEGPNHTDADNMLRRLGS